MRNSCRQAVLDDLTTDCAHVVLGCLATDCAHGWCLVTWQPIVLMGGAWRPGNRLCSRGAWRPGN